MKKFLLSMIALVAAFAASAAVVYFDNSTANWSNVNVYTFSEETMGKWPGTAMTQGADGLWSVDVTEGCTKIIFNNGTGAQTGNLDYIAGATYNKDGIVGAAKQHVYFKNTDNWSAVYAYTWMPEMYGAWPGTELKPNADGLYEIEFTAAPSGLKFHNNAGSDTPDITTFSDGDIFDAAGTLVGDNPTPPTPPTPAGDKTLYVIGNFCGWDLSSALKMDHEEGTNIYTLTTDVMDGKEWKICDGTWAYSFGAGAATQPDVNNDAWFNSPSNFSGILGSTTITFTLVEGSDVEGSSIPSILNYTGTAPTPTTPDALYLIGDMIGNHWDPSNGLALTKNGDKFNATVEIETAYENDYGYFSFCTALGATPEDWSVGTRYGASASNTLIATGETTPFIVSTNSWMILPGKYDVTVDFSDNTVTVAKNTSGIENVVADGNESAVYFNLQGVRVAVPQAGALYIVKRGDKVSKEIAR